MATTRTSHKNTSIALAACIISILCAACNDDVAMTETHRLDSNGWSASETIDFNLDPEAYKKPESNRFAKITAAATGDTIKRLHGDYEARLALRYRDDCNAASVQIVVEHISLDNDEDNHASPDTITFPLFTETGKASGSGRFGIYESSVALPKPIHIYEGSVISVHPVEYNTLPVGLTDITLTLLNK